jgi:hypothetical protein
MEGLEASNFSAAEAFFRGLLFPKPAGPMHNLGIESEIFG